MPSESHNLPPLKPPIPAMVPVETLVTVGRVTLAGGDIPRAAFKDFYTRLLGLVFVDADDTHIRFRHHQREIRIDRDCLEIRRAGIMIRSFGEALQRLRAQKTPYELLHTDGGLTRVAIVRDPAGNWIHLLETRAF